jgi:predicted  nucleic acid-binding Zn-ribbon protein
MLETIEKLLILQDRDRNIRRVKGELAHIEPQRQVFQAKIAAAATGLDHAKLRVKQIETARKELELEVEGKKEQITRYANQQFQTRKNEEYRALAHEIDTCKAAIVTLEDKQLDLMEQGEQAQADVGLANKGGVEMRKLAEEQIANLNTREQNLKKELAELEANREELASAVGESDRARYERLMRNKGESVVVGVQHGVCGGCHMKLPPQLLVTAQAQQELVSCSNCGRILYYTRDMDLAVAD